MLGAVGKLPDIYTELEINYFLLRRLLGVKSDDKKQTKVTKLAKGEVLMVNIGSTSTGGRVLDIKADLAKISLLTPACTDLGEKVALSRRIDKHWRLIGVWRRRETHADDGRVGRGPERNGPRRVDSAIVLRRLQLYKDSSGSRFKRPSDGGEIAEQRDVAVT